MSTQNNVASSSVVRTEIKLGICTHFRVLFRSPSATQYINSIFTVQVTKVQSGGVLMQVLHVKIAFVSYKNIVYRDK